MRDDGPTYNVLDVWRMGYTGKGVVVSVVDEGLDKNHKELKQNYVSIKLPYYMYVTRNSKRVETCHLCSHHLNTHFAERILVKEKLVPEPERT